MKLTIAVSIVKIVTQNHKVIHVVVGRSSIEKRSHTLKCLEGVSKHAADSLRSRRLRFGGVRVQPPYTQSHPAHIPSNTEGFSYRSREARVAKDDARHIVGRGRDVYGDGGVGNREMVLAWLCIHQRRREVELRPAMLELLGVGKEGVVDTAVDGSRDGREANFPFVCQAGGHAQVDGRSGRCSSHCQRQLPFFGAGTQTGVDTPLGGGFVAHRRVEGREVTKCKRVTSLLARETAAHRQILIVTERTRIVTWVRGRSD